MKKKTQAQLSFGIIVVSFLTFLVIEKGWGILLPIAGSLILGFLMCKIIDYFLFGEPTVKKGWDFKVNKSYQTKNHQKVIISEIGSKGVYRFQGVLQDGSVVYYNEKGEAVKKNDRTVGFDIIKKL